MQPVIFAFDCIVFRDGIAVVAEPGGSGGGSAGSVFAGSTAQCINLVSKLLPWPRSGGQLNTSTAAIAQMITRCEREIDEVSIARIIRGPRLSHRPFT